MTPPPPNISRWLRPLPMHFNIIATWISSRRWICTTCLSKEVENAKKTFERHYTGPDGPDDAVYEPWRALIVLTTSADSILTQTSRITNPKHALYKWPNSRKAKILGQLIPKMTNILNRIVTEAEEFDKQISEEKIYQQDDEAHYKESKTATGIGYHPHRTTRTQMN